MHKRPGSILIVVTVVLLMVSLAVVGLLSMVRLDYQATKMRGRELMMESALQLAESHVVAVAQQTREQRYAGGNLTRSPELFAKQPLFIDADEESQIQFSVVIPADASERETLSYGLINESAKLNLNSLIQWEKQFPGTAERALLELPGMQPEQAAAILDWIDADSMPRLQGGELEQYQSEQRAAFPTNGVPANLEVLAQVRLTTLSDWMAEATTVSGINSDHDSPNSNRKNESRLRGGNDNRMKPGSGSYHRPWEYYLTVCSRERNESFNGQPRIFLNDNDLVQLHRDLSVRASPTLADFVILYRQFGPGRGGRRQALSEANLDFSLPAKFQFNSELDLVGATVTLPGGRTTWLRFDSPLGSNRSGWAGQLEYLMDQITVNPNPIIEGRINIDEAPREVLLAIPGIDPTTADRILAARFLSADGRVAHVHATWILEQGVVDLGRMKELMRFCTTGGDVFQANIVAYIPQTAWFLREIVAIDGAEKVPVKLYCKDRRDSVNPYELEQ